MKLDQTGQFSYRPDIDGLRAVAVLSVMIYHINANLLPGGFVGVDVFFVVSGFVVTASLIGTNASSLPVFIRDFYARRLARILPALVLMLVTSAFLATLFIPNAWLSGFSETTAKYAFFGLSNWILQSNTETYFAPRSEFNPYTHTWSLGVEEQFYLLAPFLVYFWIRAARVGQEGGVRVASGALIALTIASIIACIWVAKVLPTVAFYFIGTRLWELALGVLLFLMTYVAHKTAAGMDSRRSNWISSLGAGVGAVLVVFSLCFADSGSFPWPWALGPVLGTLLLIGSAQTRQTDPVRRALASPPTVWLGKRSYSLYLWHWPVYVLMRWTTGLDSWPLVMVALALTFVLASLSYRFIEQPLRHNARLEGFSAGTRIAFFLAFPIIGFMLVSQFFNYQGRLSLSTVAHNRTDWYVSSRMRHEGAGERACEVSIERNGFEGGRETRFVPQQCKGAALKPQVFVLGDSHAGMLSAVVDQLAAEHGLRGRIFSFPGCSYMSLKAPMSGAADAGCVAFNIAATRKILSESQPGDVVLLSSLRLERYGDQWASFEVGDMYSKMYSPEKMSQRRAALEEARQWLKAFSDHQLRVIFTAPTPVFKAPPYRCSDWFNRMNPICVGQNQIPRHELERLRQPILDAMRTLEDEFPGVSVVDTFPVLCPEPVCRADKNGRPLFFDGDHLSGYGDFVVYPVFEQAILSVN